MSYRDEDDEAFYDACYENWRRGGSPDLDRDDYEDYRARGFDPEESGSMLVRRERERAERRQAEQEGEEE